MLKNANWFTAMVLAGALVPASAALAQGGANDVTTTGSADLAISGSASTGSPNSGGRFSYTFSVKNTGAVTAEGASFSELLPAGFGFESATANGAPERCTLSGGAVTCDLLFVAPGTSQTVVVNAYAPTTVGAYVATAAVSTVTPESSMANNNATVTVQVKTAALDTTKVSKCFFQTGGQMLLKAASSDASARLFAYRPDGSLIGEVQNGGGSRYGGTVMPWQPYDPVYVTFRSSSGGSVTVPTTPFVL